MTVGIGVLCQGGKCIVMAADLRGSFEDASLPPHEYIGKQYGLPLGFAANTAGAKTVCQSVLSELHSQIDKLRLLPTIYHDHIRNAIREAQFQEFLYRVDQKMRYELTITPAEWRTLPETSLLYRRGQKLIRRCYLNLEITVGGFLRDESPVILTAQGNEGPEMNDLSVIGSGSDVALRVLVKRCQEPHMSAVRTILHVYEAMKEAESKDQYVGRCTTFLVLSPKQHRLLQLDSPFMKELVGAFSGRETEPLDDDEKRFKALMDELHDVGLTRAEYHAGKRRLTHPEKPIGERYS